jgi:hypothetical protein
MLRVVLVNLLSNAIKFTRRQSQAKIEIGSADENKDEIVELFISKRESRRPRKQPTIKSTSACRISLIAAAPWRGPDSFCRARLSISLHHRGICKWPSGGRKKTVYLLMCCIFRSAKVRQRSTIMKSQSILDWYRILRAHHQWTMFQAIRYALWLAR